MDSSNLTCRAAGLDAMPWMLCLIVVWLAGCGPLPMVSVPSANQNSRANYLVLHFTSAPFDESLHLLTRRTDRPVSAHYLVPDLADATYPHRKLKIYRLVAEERRAWHAGRSFWRGQGSLNDTSIGIEIVNRSSCTSRQPEAAVQTPEMQVCSWLDFPQEQIDLVIRLAQDILRRHPNIDPVDVVGHSDIAPTRRLDPGPKFPWKRLHEHGIGAWFDEDTVGHYRRRFDRHPPSLELVQQGLQAYGYRLEVTGEPDHLTRSAVRAFQMHFRPALTNGRPDTETASVLFALLEKYHPEHGLLLETPTE